MSHTKHHLVSHLLAQYLTPKNARAASIAFMSPALSRAARNKQLHLVEKVARYRGLWAVWFRGLSNAQRITITRDVFNAMLPGGALKYHTSEANPLFLARKALSKQTPNLVKSSGTMGALYDLSRPAVSAVLQRHGLPFSMANARRNLLLARNNTTNRVNRHVIRNGGGRMSNVPLRMSIASAGAAIPKPPPKGLKGYAGKRIRRDWRSSVGL